MTVTQINACAMLLLSSVLLSTAAPTHASTPEAWAELSRNVDRACRQAATENGLRAVQEVRIDPYGDETKAYALLRRESEEKGEELLICIYTKADGAVTISGPLLSASDFSENASSEEPEQSLIPQTDLVFSDENFPMTADDRIELATLPIRVLGTLSALQAEGWRPDSLAGTIAQNLAAEQTTLNTIRPGRYQCNVFRYGFLDNARQFMGTHRCRVERDRLGNLVVLKLTGRALNATLLEIQGGGIAFGGRTAPSGSLADPYDPEFPADRLNDNFGNVVGRVLTEGRRIYLIDIDQRGMTEPDPTFFQVIELAPDR